MKARRAAQRPVSFSVADAAQRLGLTAAQVRRFAEAYRDFLGLRRAGDGDWTFTAEQLRFLGVLAAGGTAAQAGAALRAGRLAAGPQTEAVPRPAPIQDAPADSQPAGAALPAEPQAAAAPAPRELWDRIDDVALCLEDLAEETKQVQILLSRIIALLEAGQHAAPAPVRPWVPAELTPAPGAVHAFIPGSPPDPASPPACSDAG